MFFNCEKQHFTETQIVIIIFRYLNLCNSGLLFTQNLIKQKINYALFKFFFFAKLFIIIFIFFFCYLCYTLHSRSVTKANNVKQQIAKTNLSKLKLMRLFVFFPIFFIYFCDCFVFFLVAKNQFNFCICSVFEKY
jgi:hypothetical protein